MALPAFIPFLAKALGSALVGAGVSKAMSPDQIGQGMPTGQIQTGQEQAFLQDLVKKQPQQPMQFEPLTYDLIRRNR